MFQSSLMSWSSQDHRAGDRREQPADDRVAPGLLVEPRVLLVVGDLLAGGRVGAAPLANPFAGARRALVDVDLVAEQEQELRPLVVVVADHLAGEDPEGVELLAVGVAVLRLHVLALVGEGDPAGAEADVDRLRTVDRADRARRQVRGGLRPAPLAVEPDLVLVEPGRLQAFDADQRVVVLLDREGRLLAAEDLDRAGRVGLDPDRRLGLADVAEQRSEDEIGHEGFPTRSGPELGARAQARSRTTTGISRSVLRW